MSYSTSYELTAEPVPGAEPAAVVAAFVRANDGARYCITPAGDRADAGRWDTHEADLLALSAQHPHLLFTLRGEGEDAGDIWAKYFLRGQVQVAQAEIQVAPFDPAKLTKGGAE